MLGLVNGLRTSYQRMPVLVEPMFTDWLATIASWSPKFRYANRYISRSASESRFEPESCGMQVPPPHAGENDAVASEIGPASVALAGVTKFGVKRQSSSELLPKSMK